MIWSAIHTFASVVMTITAVFMLAAFRARYNLAERIGLGLIGGCGFLRVNVIWEVQQSPFYQWAPTLLTFGFGLLLAGRGYRDWHHEWGNIRMRVRGWLYLREKGKL